MKQGAVDLVTLARDVQNRGQAKNDLVVDNSQVKLEPADGNGNTVARIADQGQFEISPIAHSQFSDKLKIPKKYYDRMHAEAPELLRNNVNWWLTSNTGKKNLFRTYDFEGAQLLAPTDQKRVLRAYLSDRYYPIENEDVLAHLLPVLHKMSVKPASMQITERSIYLKMLFPDMTREILNPKKVKDIVEAGLVIGNSEVGLGKLYVTPFIHQLSCLNGAIFNKLAHTRTHIGKQLKAGENHEIYSDKTRKADDNVFLMKIEDTIKHFLNRENFNALVDSYELTGERRLEARADKVVETLAKKVTLTSNESDSILEKLIEGGDLTQFGLVNAVTRASQDVEDYDRATELEKIGGDIVDLPATDWKVISEARLAA